MIIAFVFKNGHKLKVKCEHFTLTHNRITGKIEGYKMSGIEGDKPLYIDLDEVLYVYKAGIDEKD